MAQYIEKDAVIAKIDELIGNLRYTEDDESMQIDILSEVEKFVNTLEVKEVDFENAYKEFVEDDYVYSKLANNIVGKAIAKHFFELGVKVNQRGE